MILMTLMVEHITSTTADNWRTRTRQSTLWRWF